MIMVQKSVNIISSPTAIHRRLPSAPSSSFSLQATRTPGLLSLSKPQPVSRRAQKQAQPKETKTSPKAVRKAAAENTKDIQVSKDVSPATKSLKAATPSSAEKDRSPRGRRAKVAAKDKASPVPVPRNASHSRNGTRRRQPHHQGSPPQPSVLANRRSPSPALDTSNQFDPFLSNSSSETESEKDLGRTSPSPVLKTIQAPSSEPKLVSRPSGKLARRRQPLADTPGTPTPSRAVPMSRGKAQPREQAVPISRSAPQQPAPARPRPTHAHTSDVAAMFPVCDDNEDEDVVPVTWQQAVLNDDGPRTAPLSSKFVDVPFFARVSTPTPARRRAEHVRSPSEGVFNLSFDDDSSATSSSGSEELKAIAGLLPRRRIVSASSSPASRKIAAPVPTEAGMYPAPFFASSNFQNSPSPDELPPPSF